MVPVLAVVSWNIEGYRLGGEGLVMCGGIILSLLIGHLIAILR